MRRISPVVATLAALVLLLFPATPPLVRVTRIERIASVSITGPNGSEPLYEVQDFQPGDGPDAATAALVRDVLRQDLEFEGAFEIAGGTAAQPVAGRDPDGLVVGSLSQAGGMLEMEVRIIKVATGEEAFARGYTAPAAQARLVAHTAADEVLLAQAGIKGVSRTRLAFVSDRGGTRRELGGMIRRFKEVWTADYDGANQQRLTSDGDLDMTPSWAPDGRAIAYTSFRRGFQDIFITSLDDRRVESPTRGAGKNWLPAWSPDGGRIAFTSGREGNEEIYVVNRDGSDLRRLTRHPAIDTSPTWSPDGGRIAFTSNRTGSPQIWVMNADGSSPQALTTEKYLRPPQLVGRDGRRDRVRLQDDDGLRHQGHQPGDRRRAPTHLRTRLQREPRLRAQRPAHCLRVHLSRRGADLGHQPDRNGPPAGHDHRQQLDAGMEPVGEQG